MFSGNLLERLRKSMHMTQEQLASKVGKTAQTVNNWEKGTLVPSIDRLEKLCEIFNVTPNYFLGFENREIIDLTVLDDKKSGHVRLIVNDLKDTK